MAEKVPANRKGTGKKLFEKGKSGNPSGRPKMSGEQRDALAEIRTLAASVPGKMREMLDSAKTPPAVKVKICEIILDRTYGKPDSTVIVSAPDYSALDEAFDRLTAMREAKYDGE